MSRKKSPVDENSLGGRIEKALGKRQMSRVSLAKATKFSPSYFSEVIRGVKEPSDKFFGIVAQRLQVSERWLRTGEGHMAEDDIADRSPGFDVEELVTIVREVMASTDHDTKLALAQNIRAFQKAVRKDERIASLERDVETLKQLLNPNTPSGAAKGT